MSSSADLILNIIAKDQGSREISNFATKVGATFQDLGNTIGGELGSVVSTVGRGFDTLGRSGFSLGAKLGAVGGASLAAGVALQSMGSAGEEAQNQLRAAILATGQSWDEYQPKIKAAIKSGENFAHSAADTQNALQTLTSATNDPAKALANFAVVEDLAAARHIDLNSAALLVAKALQGNTRLLKQYGIATDGVAKSTDKAQAAVNQLGQRLSGQAAASVDSFNGRLEVIKTKISDFVDGLAGPVGSALSNFGGAISGVAVAFELTQAVLARIRTARLASAAAAAVEATAVTADTAALVANADAEALVGDAALAAAAKVKIATAGFAGMLALAAKAKALAGFIGAGAALAGADATYNHKALQDQANRTPLPQFVLDDAKNSSRTQAAKQFAAIAKQMGVSVEELTKLQPAYARAVADAGTATEKAGVSLRTYGVYTQQQVFYDGQAVAAHKDVAESLRQGQEDLRFYGSATAASAVQVRASATAHRDLSDELRSLTPRQILLNRAATAAATVQGALAYMAGLVTQSMREQVVAFNDAIGRYQNAKIAAYDAADALDTARAAIKGLGKGAHESGKVVRDNMRLIIDAASKVKASFADAGKGNDAYIATLENLRRGIRKGSPLWNALNAYINQLLHLKAIGTITTLLQLKIQGKNVAVGQGAHNAASAKIHGFASGGMVPGPLGTPQLAVVHGGERVLTAAEAKAGGTVINHITINTKLGSDEVVRVIKDYTRANSNRWAR